MLKSVSVCVCVCVFKHHWLSFKVTGRKNNIFFNVYPHSCHFWFSSIPSGRPGVSFDFLLFHRKEILLSCLEVQVCWLQTLPAYVYLKLSLFHSNL